MRKIYSLAFCLISAYAFGQTWHDVETKNESTARSENSMVAVKGKLYLFGGRGMKPMEVYDPKTGLWEKRGELPLEIHHFQAVNYNNEIYVLGALSGPFPHETPIPNIYIYNPKKDEWRKGPEIPRKRGAAGCFVYKGKIYMVNGIQDGHWDGHVNWFDSYDPKTGEWEILPDSPHARDHINVAVAKDMLVVAGGRKSQHRTNEVFTLVVPYTDVFNFKKQKWHTAEGQIIPTMRAGNAVAVLGDKVLFMGGEGPDQEAAHDEVEAFDVKSMTWSSLPKLNHGRHGMSATQIGSTVYISSGVAKRGGSPEQNSMECLGCE
ncbi:galactose oxidase [Marinilongibacter aquaticus]|uniref:Kelch repeat-containing protein n=1 Tax=Marinilongibacter aquaticus TaxID=2975157 RepID=UPI0021BDDC0A|nr:kelch repeat-containing protein [Marinilongibacter aquaticus]UBM60622.1 galactose oxidase [Marinilongibacter aquaticus]